MAGVTSLPVRVKFWRGARLSGPAIMVCTNVLVSQSKHSKSCYLLSFSLLLSNSASLFFFFFFFFPWSKRSGAVEERKGSSLKSKSGKRDWEEWEEGRERGEKVVEQDRDWKTDACKLTNINRLGPHEVCPLNHVWNAGKHTTYWSSSRHLLLFGAASGKNPPPQKKKTQMGLKIAASSWVVQRARCTTAHWSSGQRPPLPPLRQRQLVSDFLVFSWQTKIYLGRRQCHIYCLSACGPAMFQPRSRRWVGVFRVSRKLLHL